MDTNLENILGFWRDWDIELLTFQIVSILNVLAVLVLAAAAQRFDFEKLLDIKNWEILEVVAFIGPIVAQAFSLIIVDSTNWLVNYDFGTTNEMTLYWVAVGLVAAVEAAGNTSSVLLVSLYALLSFLLFGAFMLIQTFLLSNPLILACLLVVILAFGIPIFLDVVGFLLIGSFGVLSGSLLLDFISLYISEPDRAIDTAEDVFTRGMASPIIEDFQNKLGDLLGEGFMDLFGTQIIQDIVDNFWLHVTLQGVVVLPLSILFTMIKIGLGVENLAQQQ